MGHKILVIDTSTLKPRLVAIGNIFSLISAENKKIFNPEAEKSTTTKQDTDLTKKKYLA